ncbi:hypothetical protein SDC9_94680 [bioreactor metagenome]|uniref:Uncharacterized protein n=1 Tax=bioreactor metagenome TaxID=1076179 RepID=A0A645A441_9ZZZZ
MPCSPQGGVGLVINADRKTPQGERAIAEMHFHDVSPAGNPAFRVEYLQAVEEILPVSAGLEAHEGVPGHLVEDFPAPGHLHEHIDAGERNVEKKGRPEARLLLPEHGPQGDELVIVHPYKIILRSMPQDNPGELGV